MSIPEKILQAGCDAYAATFLNGNGSLGDGIEAAYLAIHLHGEWVHSGPPAWTGEGLPPVGAVCQIKDLGPCHKRYRKHCGKQVTILAHSVGGDSLPTAVYKVNSGLKSEYHALVAECFEPINTPKKIGAEDRREAIATMARIANEATGMLMNSATEADFAALYDAGYRKFEIVDGEA